MYKIVINILFVLDHILIYFILISKINNSTLHFYYFIMFVLGIIFYTKFYKKIDLKSNKWYTWLKNIGGEDMKKKAARKRFIMFLLLYIVVGAVLVQNTGSSFIQIYEKNKEKRQFKEELAKLKDKEDELKGTVTKLQDPDYIARYAREKYLYSKDGEIIIRIPE